MDKLLIFPGRTEQGVFNYVIDTEKTYLEKTACEYHPTIADYIRNAKPIPGKIQILLTALGAGEIWGCFLEGAPILMGDGSEKPIEQIEKGDLVWTHKNRPRQVLQPMGRYYSGVLYNFGFRSWGTALECTEEHPIFGVTEEDLNDARKKYYKQKESYQEFISKLEYGFRPAKDWSIGDYVCVPFPQETLTNKELSQPGWDYLMGWYLAEGTLVKNYGKPGQPLNKIIWTLGGDEGDVAQRIKSICEGAGHSVKVVEDYGDKSCIRVETHWTDLASACAQHLGTGSKTKRLSTDVLAMPKQWQLEFLSAYLDGDGCQTKGRGRYHGSLRSSTTSKKLSIDLCKLAARLGYSASFFKCKQHHTSKFSAGNTIYENGYERALSLELNVPSFDKVAPLVRSGRSSYIDVHRGYILVPISSVATKDYEGSVFNLEVEEDNSYCANSFAVHNCNANGDFFPEYALAHEGNDYGYKTFESTAKIYKHHVNKDPAAAYGDVALSVYNPKFRRVELIVVLDVKKAPDIAQRIEAGESVDWSMGCKVPYDICNLCGNKAPTRKEYCEHLKYYIGRIYPPLGRVAYAINSMPKFFDISYVFIGADRIAKSHLKVASKVTHFPSSSWLAEKMAGNKEATMEKEVPAGDGVAPVSMATVKDLAAAITEVKSHEKPIPKEVLNTLARHPISEVMSTLAMLGILPKPQEFQRIYLVHKGRPDFADQLDRENVAFDPLSVESPLGEHERELGLNYRSFNPYISKMLSPFIEDRSYIAPVLGRRITIILEKRASFEEKPVKLIKVAADQDKTDKRKPIGIIPMLAMAAGLYAAFAKQAPKESLKGIDKVLASDPALAAAIGLGLMATFNPLVKPGVKGNYIDRPYVNPDANDVFSRIEAMKQKPYVKVASMGPAAKRLLLGIPLAYMASGVLQKHRELNPYDEESRVKSFIRRYPDVVSGALVADAMLSAKGRGTHGVIKKVAPVAKSYFDKGVSALKSLGAHSNFKTASAHEYLSNALIWPLAMGGGNIPGKVVSGLFDQAVLDAGSKLLERRKQKGKQQV